MSKMKFSSLTDRVKGDAADVWNSHYQAVAEKKAGKDVIVLSVGDPDFDTPAAVIRAATKAMEAGDTHYTPVAGDIELRQCVAAKHQCSTGQVVSTENVIIASGAQNALFNVTMCIAEAGDEIIVLQPMYVTYEATIQAPNATLIPVVLDEAAGFRLDEKRLVDAITARTTAIYFATPSNPTGVALNQQELEVIGRVAIENNLWIVSDEVYSELVFEGNFHHIATLPGMAERTVTIGSMSKTFAMTGWRVGWAIGPAELIANTEMVALCMLYGLPGFIQKAARYALLNCNDEAERMRSIYRKRRDNLFDQLNRINGLRPLLPDAGMFLMLDVRDTGLSATEFVSQLYQQQAVSVLDATAFGSSAAGYVRISFGIDDKELNRACERIANFVSSLTEVSP
ncbi:MAG: arginine:pyruvate transaminase [Gammaproteobacteria bacterium]|jgi:arginine:pyruvate transaminase